MSSHPDEALWSALLSLDRACGVTLQAQIRSAIAQAILDRRLPAGTPMPATRGLAERLRVGRNTVTLAYQSLVKDGFLVALARSGYVVNEAVNARSFAEAAPASPRDMAAGASRVDWSERIGTAATSLRQVSKAADWQRAAYPFVYGQFDPDLFPQAAWREANAMAARGMAMRDWACDRGDRDDPLLVAQIQQRLLSRRGIWAAPDEIVPTLGAQQGVFLAASLVRGQARCVGLEDPGYPDLRNVFSYLGIATRSLPLDADGLVPGPLLSGCDYVCVAPSHHNPTSVTMPLARRKALLAAAQRHGFVIVEDDYDSELTFTGQATPALKSLDEDGRVIYVGSLSKTIAPGLRVGYLVGPAAFIEQARALRRLMLRHPPANNQRAVALFLSLGHHDALIRRLVGAYRERAAALCEALTRHLPEVRFQAPRGGSALWASAPPGCDMRRVQAAAAQDGVLFDAGDTFFAASRAPLHHFRLGYASIPLAQIEPGVALLARALRGVMERGQREGGQPELGQRRQA